MKRIALVVLNWFCILTAFIWLPPVFWWEVFTGSEWGDVLKGKEGVWE